MDFYPRIVSALIEEPRRIRVQTDHPVKCGNGGSGGFHLKADNAEVQIQEVNPVGNHPNGEATEVDIVTADNIDVCATYVVSHQGYQEKQAIMAGIFDSPHFEENYCYEGGDLGAVYTPQETRFRVWAPTARSVSLVTYSGSEGGEGKEYTMSRDLKGTWVAAVSGDLDGVYYTYRVTFGNLTGEVVDPYARAVGVNGRRGMVVDLSRTNPDGWNTFPLPPFERYTDAIVYELHIRDLSIHGNSGIRNKGKFLGLTERGTRGPNGVRTGLDHLEELGITHLHLLPCFDFASVDEKSPDPEYNWGYDPQNFNAPEGSYSTDPYHGAVRIREFKEMVKALAGAGVRTVMDVVYNHTFTGENSNLNLIVPYYYYRFDGEGGFSNGSGCGNELADERPMVRKFIVDSVVYWAQEYRIRGFRFDLMGLHTIETMNAVRQALNEVDPSIIVYGEGWTGGASPIPSHKRTLKANIHRVPGVGVFSDEVRDGIKGHVFEDRQPGFVNGAHGAEDSVKFGITAAVRHFQVDYWRVNYSHEPWAASPEQAVVYAEAHDNLTLWDKLEYTNPDEDEKEYVKMYKLTAAIVLTSQGIPFLHAGQEFARTKYGDHNSYRSPDSVNQIDWSRKAHFRHLFDYHRGLIRLRKSHPAFRMVSAEDIRRYLRFLETPPNVIAYMLGPHANDDQWGAIAVILNANRAEKTIELPRGEWIVVVNEHKAGVESLGHIPEHLVIVPARSSLVLVDAESHGAKLEG